MFLVTVGLAGWSGLQLYRHQFRKRFIFWEIFSLGCIFIGALFAILEVIFFPGAAV